MSLHCEPWIGSVLGSVAIQDCSTVVQGLRFYTPDIVDGPVLTAYEWCAANLPAIDLRLIPDEPDGVYALTASGEHLLTDLDVSALQKLDEELQRLRLRKDGRAEETRR